MPRAPEKSGWKMSRSAAGSSCRHGMRMVRSGRIWPTAKVVQNMYGASTIAR